MVSILKGYKCILVVFLKLLVDKIDMFKVMGVEVYVCFVYVLVDDYCLYYEVVKRIYEEILGFIYIN